MSLIRSLPLILLGMIPCPGAASGEQGTLLFFPAENLSQRSALTWIGEGLAISVANQLGGVGLEVVDRETRIRLTESAGLRSASGLSRASMISLGRKAGVSFLVSGTYAGTEGSIRIAIQVLDMKQMKLGREILVSGALQSLPEMENEVAWIREAMKRRLRSTPRSHGWSRRCES